MSYDYTQAGYSPEVLDYVQNLEQQRQDLFSKYAGQGVGFENLSEILTPRQVQQAASDEIKTEFAPESAVRAFMAQNPDISSAIDTGYHVRSYGDSRDPSVYNDVLLPFDGNYTFTDKATGKTFSPSTPEELRAITQAANGMSTIGTDPMKDSNYGGGNNSANWEITRNGERVAYDSPYTPSFLKQAGQTLADIGTDYILPALGTAIAGPLGAGFTTAAVQGIGKDKSLEDSLKAGALSALTSYGMGQVSPYINSSLKGAGLDFAGLDTMFSPETPSFWGAAGGDGLVAPNFTGPSAPGYSGADLSSLLNTGSFAKYLGDVGGVESAVVGATRPDIKALALAFPGLSDADLAQLAQYMVPGDGYGGATESVVVNPARQANALPAAAGLAALGTGAALAGGVSPADSVVVNPAKTTAGMSPTEIALIAAATGGGALAASGAAGAGGEEASLWDKALKYSPLLSLLGALGGTGGSGAGGSGTIPNLPNKEKPSIFSAKLPTSRVVSPFAVAQNMGTEDWTKYGLGKEKSFFSNIPGTPIGYAKGGLAVKRARSHVRGPGTGTSDSIPALLSNGEYVLTAKDVTKLGAGDNDAGAKKLDRFRVALHKPKKGTK